MRPARLLRLALLLLLLAGAARADEAPELLLEVRLGQHLLADAIRARQHGEQVLLPLGELARLLTIAIRVNPAEGQAGGFILAPQRTFLLDLNRQTVIRGGAHESYDPALVRRASDDIYVAAGLLARWLPADFELDMATLQLKVRAREKLPLQARLERLGKAASGAPGAPADPGYARVATPYRLARAPFADLTLGADLRRGSGGRAGGYTAYLTADLLAAEAALYLNGGQAARLTLGRHDPDAGLLGPLRARSAHVGSVAGAAAPHIALGSAYGNGVLVSNRAPALPARFDRHRLAGDLPPGWDVELYFNEALIGFQQARPDGRYSFDDLALIYGANLFRLVFHGPLGQVRVERHTFLLEQAMLAPGQFDYSASALRDAGGDARSALQFDWGVGRRLTAGAALLRMPVHGARRSYASASLQAYLDGLVVSATAARSGDGGRLAQLGLKTRVGTLALAASRAVTRDFVSDFYLPGPDSVRLRDELRADGALAAMPLLLQARRERLASGRENLELGTRLSSFHDGTAVSHALRWQSAAGAKHADGQLQASRRLAAIGISGQLHYTLAPQAALSTLALAADQRLAGGYQAAVSVTRSFADPHYRFAASLNKSLGRFGMGLNGWATSRGEYGAGLLLFMALGREPRSTRWLADAVPMAASGSAAPRVFLDHDRNGVMDGADTPIAGAGFIVNGAAQAARTDAAGVAWLRHLVPNQHADIALDPATLEEPQWRSAVPGMRIVPRAGSVGELDFAVSPTAEIDGTAWLVEQGTRRGAGDLELELVDATDKVVARTVSGADGYFLLADVAPGAYRLRIAPAQLARLGLPAPPPRAVLVDRDANFVNGQDVELQRRAALAEIGLR